MYYIGIDGGTSYSKLIGVDNEMKVVGRHMGNAVNLCKLQRETALGNLTRLMAEFSKLTNSKPQDCAGVCIGVAGLDEPNAAEGANDMCGAFLETLRAAGYECGVKAVSGAEIVLATHTKGGPGILVSSSIDAFAFAVDDNGQMYRCGGLGHALDGGGGGYVMGMQAVKYAFMSYDGRIPHTVLEDKVCEHFAVKSIDDARTQLRGGAFGPGKIAELALVVKYAAESGDGYAKLIQETAARELYLLARALTAKCELQEPSVSLSGPVLVLNDVVRDGFTAMLKKDYPKIKIETVKEKPEMGAVYLAMMHAGVSDLK